MRRGVIQRAVIARIADQRRIPVAVAAHSYDCMSMAKKNALCAAEQRRAPLRALATPPETTRQGESDAP